MINEIKGERLNFRDNVLLVHAILAIWDSCKIEIEEYPNEVLTYAKKLTSHYRESEWRDKILDYSNSLIQDECDRIMNKRKTKRLIRYNAVHRKIALVKPFMWDEAYLKHNHSVHIDTLKIGDSVRLYYRAREKYKNRCEVQEGTVIKIQNGPVGKLITIRSEERGICLDSTVSSLSPRLICIDIIRNEEILHIQQAPNHPKDLYRSIGDEIKLTRKHPTYGEIVKEKKKTTF